MTWYSVTLNQSLAQLKSAPKRPAAVERSITLQLFIHLFPLQWIISLFKQIYSLKQIVNSSCRKYEHPSKKSNQMIHLMPNFVTSFSSSLILLLFCLDLIFSRSKSAVSSLFFLDSSTILVAAISPANPDVPKQTSGWDMRKLWRIYNITVVHN